MTPSNEQLAEAFAFGIQIAEAVHEFDDVTPMETINCIVHTIAAGEHTLLDTPSEFIADVGPLPQSLESRIPELLRGARENHKLLAKAIEP